MYIILIDTSAVCVCVYFIKQTQCESYSLCVLYYKCIVISELIDDNIQLGIIMQSDIIANIFSLALSCTNDLLLVLC